MRIGRGLVFGAGFFLIGAGIGLLIWSHVLASGTNASANAWWAGTLQALGVGSAVGGIVDVLVISGLEGVTRAEAEKRQDLNARARVVLAVPEPDWHAAWDLLSEGKGLMDRDLRKRLYAVLDANLGPDWRRQPPGRATGSQTATAAPTVSSRTRGVDHMSAERPHPRSRQDLADIPARG